MTGYDLNDIVEMKRRNTHVINPNNGKLFAWEPMSDKMFRVWSLRSC